MSAPERIKTAHNGGLPTGNYPEADKVELVRADLYAAALEREAALREAADSLYQAIRGLLKWDQERKHLVPYRVRDPIHKAMRAVEAAALGAKP